MIDIAAVSRAEYIPFVVDIPHSFQGDNQGWSILLNVNVDGAREGSGHWKHFDPDVALFVPPPRLCPSERAVNNGNLADDEQPFQ